MGIFICYVLPLLVMLAFVIMVISSKKVAERSGISSYVQIIAIGLIALVPVMNIIGTFMVLGYCFIENVFRDIWTIHK